MKRMACILNKDDVLERCVCPVCEKVHCVNWSSWVYFEYSENGPVVGRYDGWDDAMDILCDECTDSAERLFGKEFILSLFRNGDLDIANFFAFTANLISQY